MAITKEKFRRPGTLNSYELEIYISNSLIKFLKLFISKDVFLLFKNFISLNPYSFFIFFIILAILISIFYNNSTTDFSLNLGFANEFMWPLPGYKTITSYFGYRNSPTIGASSYHSGLDIAAPERYLYCS